MFDLSVSCVPRPYLYMLRSSSLTQVFCVCKTGLHPLYANIESITPDHHEVLRNDELSPIAVGAVFGRDGASFLAAVDGLF